MYLEPLEATGFDFGIGAGSNSGSGAARGGLVPDFAEGDGLDFIFVAVMEFGEAFAWRTGCV